MKEEAEIAGQLGSEDAGQVLFSEGSRFGGHALYVKDRAPDLIAEVSRHH